MGYNQEKAEEISFIGDLRNVISLIRSHGSSAKTADNILRQTPDEPFNFESTEEEEEEEEEKDATVIRSEEEKAVRKPVEQHYGRGGGS